MKVNLEGLQRYVEANGKSFKSIIDNIDDKPKAVTGFISEFLRKDHDIMLACRVGNRAKKERDAKHWSQKKPIDIGAHDVGLERNLTLAQFSVVKSSVKEIGKFKREMVRCERLYDNVTNDDVVDKIAKGSCIEDIITGVEHAKAEAKSYNDKIIGLRADIKRYTLMVQGHMPLKHSKHYRAFVRVVNMGGLDA